MKHRLPTYLPVFLFACLLGCHSGKKKDVDRFFPTLSYLKSQVAHIDTSLYSIRKLIYVDSLRTDTIYVHRDSFRLAASDFLTIPDLALPEYASRYEEEHEFDQTLNRVDLILTPLDPDKEEIQREEVLIKPDPTGDKVTTIIINTIINNKDSLVQKRLLWNVDRSFQVTTTRQIAGNPETTSTFKVVWNEDEE